MPIIEGMSKLVDSMIAWNMPGRIKGLSKSYVLPPTLPDESFQMGTTFDAKLSVHCQAPTQPSRERTDQIRLAWTGYRMPEKSPPLGMESVDGDACASLRVPKTISSGVIRGRSSAILRNASDRGTKQETRLTHHILSNVFLSSFHSPHNFFIPEVQE